MKSDTLYTFYGRAAYRVAGDGAIRLEGACPICFVLNSELLKRSNKIHPFDTGAYHRRLYKHVFADEIGMSDFEISDDWGLINTLVSTFYGETENYFFGNTSSIPSASELCTPDEMHVRAYHELITSSGRNEPDDRVMSIEVTFSDPILLAESLRAIIVPHTIWNGSHKTSWLQEIEDDTTEIVPYEFHPGRAPDYYMAHIETQLRDLYAKWGLM